ncbi:MAG: hypothetical protein ABIH11_05820 [Candidatus Altiarchaeota archaeon]
MVCCDNPFALRFKLSILGVMLSFALTMAGFISPFREMLVLFPLTWLFSLIILIPSIGLYYAVKEDFWAEVINKKNKST